MLVFVLQCRRFPGPSHGLCTSTQGGTVVLRDPLVRGMCRLFEVSPSKKIYFRVITVEPSAFYVSIERHWSPVMNLSPSLLMIIIKATSSIDEEDADKGEFMTVDQLVGELLA